jgi:N-acetylmuramoyl-L-alanine amidase
VLAAAALALSILPAGGAARDARTLPRRVEVRPGVEAAVEDGNRLVLRVRAQAGAGYRALARQYAADEGSWEAIEKANASSLLRVGRTYRIPFEILSEPVQLQAFLALFPLDRFEADAWVHVAGRGALPTYQESLWALAEWLTGDGQRYQEIQQASGLEDVTLSSGQEARVPLPLLKPHFRRWAEARLEESRTPSELSYGRDAEGEYALYRLKAGEALYSAVVMRFTGRVEPAEVNAIAARIARRSGIPDVTDIPVCQSVKIPYDLLLPEHLPPTDPRRIEVEATRREAETFRNPGGARDLAGVTVILDSGHGGVDAGAVKGGVHEDELVYDILCRIKRLLERETSATVKVTIRDRLTGHAPRDRESLPHDTREVILTDPPYQPRSRSLRAVGVNLRWYLVNSYYRDLRARGVPADRVLFASLHADSLHPSARGAMVYVPGERYRRGRYGNRGGVYANHREVRQEAYVSFTRRERLQSEGLSRDFGSHMVQALRREGLRVHPFQPVRDHVVRRGRAWVPAVIRCSRVPTKVLLEVGNLNNAEDRALLRKPAMRESVARAFVNAVRSYYR